ncbi:YopX family protein [Bacillus glycinifermentans]|uniref:YopX family protein n=1 Tax=Bacillus glycinifermentans TaxID=1664069 RepID=UPI002DB7D392|nr:YopX family protein [Bacillus glycinifermentans]MEC3608790.1 YopX family protein [Bacillus glycinifermentans]
MTHEYRVWDGEHMHYWDDEGISLTIKNDGSWFLYHDAGGGCVVSSDDKDAALIWGTGEKDEGGKMIYPGDVVEYEEPSFTGSGTEYLRRRCVIFLSFGGRHNVPTRFRRNLKVIGDAYENPDLLDELEAAE